MYTLICDLSEIYISILINGVAENIEFNVKFKLEGQLSRTLRDPRR